MHIIDCRTGEKVEVEILPVNRQELLDAMKQKRFGFDWRTEVTNEVYQLVIKQTPEIMGLMSLTVFEQERWIKINLLESSVENVGKKKVYDRIAGCLIAFACRIAFIKDFDGTVALEPKTDLANHYKDIYNFQSAGKHLYTELKNSQSLIAKYLSDQ